MRTLPPCATRRPQVDADLIAGCLASSARRVLLEDATDITVPTLLVRGSDDPFVSDGDLQILAARLACRGDLYAARRGPLAEP